MYSKAWKPIKNITPGRLRVQNVSSCDILQSVASESVRGNCEQKVSASDGGVCSFRCHCLRSGTSFVVSEKKCIEEKIFRAGCYFVLGSWTWRNGWTWDGKIDPLPILNIALYGMTSAFNASSNFYTKCEVTSVSKYGAEGFWEALDPVFFEEASTVFFKLRGMWHITWAISELNSSRRNEIEGRFIRLDVKCFQNKVIDGEVLSNDFSSCVLLKTTGNMTHLYKTNKNNTEVDSTEEERSSIFSNTWVLVGIIAGCVLLLAGVVTCFLYRLKFIKFKATVQTENAVKYNCNNVDLMQRV